MDYHLAGPTHVLNGGIIATIIDCHSICTAIAASHRAEGRAMNTEPSIWYVTASLQVTYLKPTPINEPVVLRARVKEMKGKKTIITCLLFAEGEECARGEVVAVRVPPAWRHAS
jgi:acyl-coenzyme A thioesterase PaaI-like protein